MLNTTTLARNLAVTVTGLAGSERTMPAVMAAMSGPTSPTVTWSPANPVHPATWSTTTDFTTATSLRGDTSTLSPMVTNPPSTLPATLNPAAWPL